VTFLSHSAIIPARDLDHFLVDSMIRHKLDLATNNNSVQRLCKMGTVHLSCAKKRRFWLAGEKKKTSKLFKNAGNGFNFVSPQIQRLFVV